MKLLLFGIGIAVGAAAMLFGLIALCEYWQHKGK